MYKNIKVLSKKENLKTKFSLAKLTDKLKHNGLIPLGIGEVNSYSSVAPILISGTKLKRFVLFIGLSSTNNIFTNSRLLHEPQYLKNYPFIMIKAKNEKDETIEVIGIDEDSDIVGKDKEFNIFGENKKLSKKAQIMIENLKNLNIQLKISQELILELENKELLKQQTFNIKVKGEVKPILKDYYIVDRVKLNKLDDKTLALWARKGWLSVIEAHSYSLRNFKTIVDMI
jgi:hypothetical protein